jgi:hypothetical protein
MVKIKIQAESFKIHNCEHLVKYKIILNDMLYIYLWLHKWLLSCVQHMYPADVLKLC